MVEKPKRPRLVGEFIRKRREALNISQRALGLLFQPPVTTQFISNVERGVTPLPPTHVPTLAQALQVNEGELLALLEKEYTLKLSGKLGKGEELQSVTASSPSAQSLLNGLEISTPDLSFMKTLYSAYKQADPKTRQAFATVCETILQISKHQ